MLLVLFELCLGEEFLQPMTIKGEANDEGDGDGNGGVHLFGNQGVTVLAYDRKEGKERCVIADQNDEKMQGPDRDQNGGTDDDDDVCVNVACQSLTVERGDHAAENVHRRVNDDKLRGPFRMREDPILFSCPVDAKKDQGAEEAARVDRDQCIAEIGLRYVLKLKEINVSIIGV